MADTARIHNRTNRDLVFNGDQVIPARSSEDVSYNGGDGAHIEEKRLPALVLSEEQFSGIGNITVTEGPGGLEWKEGAPNS
ncbi:MAG: hypothetical protein ACK4UN_13190 [Limisphaerales bacterium]